MLLKIYHSLPVQLLLLNLKRNRLILLLWVVLFTIITGKFARTYGIPYLFLDPEYLNDVNFWSLFILGYAFGIFSMSYHITIYILESYRFQFLMIRENSFSRFCLNNSSFPFLFILIYIYNFIHFQLVQGGQQLSDIMIEVGGFLLGFHITLLLTLVYFGITGSKIFKAFTQSLNDTLKTKKMNRVGVIQKIKMVKRKNYHVDYYLDFPLVVKKIDTFIPYDKALISKVIDQNHVNALLLEITGFVFILVLGYFRDNIYFQIPAGASILILISIVTMFMGAFSYWLKGWTLYAIAALLITANYAIQFKIINPEYQVFGLNYDANYAEYSNSRINQLSNSDTIRADFTHNIKILDNWRSKFPATAKPKIVFICTSGGGQRAAVWALRTLQVTDSLTNGNLMKHSFCITGASGGLIGASYYRELFLRKQLNESLDPASDRFVEKIAKDILNPIVFSLIVNDIFFRFEKFTDGKYHYIKDRGYAFEKQLNANTDGFLNRKVIDYRQFEEDAHIPLLLLTPSVINDGRKLYISPQPLSFMNATNLEQNDIFRSKVHGIEFMRFYKEQDAQNLGFLSALRMSATFPYITPNINLPSTPSMEVMDAGLTDNYGIIDAVRFVHIFREWIKENTGGVVFMVIRDSPKQIPIDKTWKPSILDRIINPIGSLYANWDWIQDNNDEYFLEYARSFLETKMDVLEFQYSPLPKDINNNNSNLTRKEIDDIIVKSWNERASLSWHLTRMEKDNLKQTIYNDINWKGVLLLDQLLKQ